MITFETQEEFENAVMEVIKSRLNISVNTRGYSNGDSDISIALYDIVDNECFSEANDTTST